MGSAKYIEESKSIYAGEWQDPEEDINFKVFEFHDEQMAKFWTTLNEENDKNK